MAASVVSFTKSAISATNPQVVSGIDWLTGDTIVVVATNESDLNGDISDPTNANLTFTDRESVADSSASESETHMWSAVAGSDQTSQSISVSHTAGEACPVGVWVLRGVGAFDSGFATRAESAQSLTTTAGGIVVVFIADWNATAAGRTGTTGTGTLTERWDEQSAFTVTVWGGEWVVTDAGTDAYGITSYSGMAATQVGCFFPSGVTKEQEGFRFRADSGVESNPTWEAAQDTDVSLPAETTKGLRVLIDFVGDPPSGAPKLQYRLVGDADSEWEDIV